MKFFQEVMMVAVQMVGCLIRGARIHMNLEALASRLCSKLLTEADRKIRFSRFQLLDGMTMRLKDNRI
jgi:hypothetical protein